MGASEQGHGRRGVCSGLCSRAQPLDTVLLWGGAGCCLAKAGGVTTPDPELCRGGGGMPWPGVWVLCWERWRTRAVCGQRGDSVGLHLRPTSGDTGGGGGWPGAGREQEQTSADSSPGRPAAGQARLRFLGGSTVN